MIENNQLRITCVHPRLDFKTVNPVMSEPYTKAELSIKATAPHFDIHSKDITCEIDSSECRAEEGLKSVKRLIADYAEIGIESAKQAAHATAEEGQMMVHAKKGENVAIELAKQKIKEKPHISGIKFIPTSRPSITWNENHIESNFVESKQSIDWNVASRANISEPIKNSLTVTEVQDPYFDIEYVGHMFDKLDQRA
jgi:hypothetical protein